MLMVIIGAGASFDSSADHQPGSLSINYRPPLANNLFQDGGLFRLARDQFPEFHALIPQINPSPGRSLEEALQKLQDESSGNPKRVQQLTAIKYYLQEVFRSLIPKWQAEIGGVTNYQALIEQINNYRAHNPGPILLVTFNYDTLLEAALKSECGMEFKVANDYISGVNFKLFKLFKLHGSENWGRFVRSGPVGLSGRANLNPWALPHEMIKHAALLKFTDDYIVTGSGLPYKGPPLYPAIAIPVVNKEIFECPQTHIGELAALIPSVTKVLTIGWRASELHFLKMLHSLKKIDLVAVAGTVHEAQEALDKIRGLGMTVGKHEVFPGFSPSVSERRFDGLLSW
jgi:hypothetical protein